MAAFRKSSRLLRRADFDRVSKQGKRSRTRHFVLLWAPNDLGRARLGIIISKRVGNSVQRNHVKRRVREWFRLHSESLPAVDLVVIGRHGAPDLTGTQVAAELVESLPKLYKGSA